MTDLERCIEECVSDVLSMIYIKLHCRCFFDYIAIADLQYKCIYLQNMNLYLSISFSLTLLIIYIVLQEDASEYSIALHQFFPSNENLSFVVSIDL